jgi:hypothetical protein
MNLLRRANFRHAAKTGPLIGACLVVLAGCAPLLGYPKDPENTDVTLANLQPYFGVAKDVEYAHSDPANRVQLRNEIILARLRAYDINFADFEKRLYGDGNGVTLGSDLVGLVLGGLTATIGGAGTKAALGAASTGVIGADTAINKDLYYQKTIPALLAQMEADRLLAKAPIIAGMKLSDADYPLFQAYIDLDTYKNAGSIPAAINAVNKDAGNAKDDAQDAITFERTSAAAQLKGIQTVQAQLKSLTRDAQYVALARAMQIYLYSRSTALQQLINSIDPKALRLSGNAKAARRVINIWVEQDDVSAANQQQWLTAIAAVSTVK